MAFPKIYLRHFRTKIGVIAAPRGLPRPLFQKQIPRFFNAAGLG